MKDSKFRHEQVVRVTEHKKSIWNWFINIKSNMKCELCPEKHIGCLDFHHRDPSIKKGCIADMARRGFGKNTILEEIEKCDILCANCHRKKHYELGRRQL